MLGQHLDGLYRTALRLCAGSRADAEDLLQESVLRACRAFHELRDEGAGRSWLFTILTRTHLNRVRTSARRRETFAGDLEEPVFERALETWRPSETPDDVLEGRLVREEITAALDALEPEIRAVVWLVDVEGFRQRDAAAMLDIPEGTVASRLYRAHRKLRKQLAQSAGSGERKNAP